MDPKQIASTLLALSGGAENISSITHCSTRLRFFVRNKEKVEVEKIKATKPVLGIVFKADELQIILGKELLPIYTEAARQYNESGVGGADESVKEKKKLTPGGVVDIVVGFVSAAATPLIPGLVAGGMLKVFLLLITLVSPAFKDGQTYALIGMVADVPFYFMPVFIAYGAAKKLGATPLYSMAVSAALLYPKFITLIGEEAVFLFGIPVMNVAYKSTMLPALLIAIFAYYCEKLLNKLIPGILKPIFVGSLTMAATFTAGVTVLGPLGDFVGSYLVHFFTFASEHFGPLALALLAACLPWLVMTGMHHAVTPLMVQAFANPGYDVFFRPSYILHNMAEGGACLGVGLRTKDKAKKAECFSLAFGCIVAGVTEPAIYGVNFRLKKPMIGVMAGGAAGGIVAGLLGATAYVYGYSTIMALPIFEKTMPAMALAIVVDIVVAAVVTAILGFDDDSMKQDLPSKSDGDANGESVLNACVEGNNIPLVELNDGMFSEKILGDGVAFIPSSDTITAPVDATICSVAETKHAIGLRLDNGVEILIHVGLDTVKMNGDGFDVLVEEGKKVTAGTTLLKFDREKIKGAGYADTVVMIVTENEQNIKVSYNL